MAIRGARVQHSALPRGPTYRPGFARGRPNHACPRRGSPAFCEFLGDNPRGRRQLGGRGISSWEGSRMMTRTLGRAVPCAAPCQNPVDWNRAADVVVIGSGATGLPAAIVACEAGCSVILVEAEKDIGGHAIISGGNIPLGGGTSVQKKYGIADSPDLLFRDLTDWSVVGPNGFPDYRYNDREIIR